ncbi:MAG TPA: hypothetical protein VMU59_00510 [Caulobacteraceae bacterium]|nr:hypothetical protein [Caulobacteraceae bacterium]
MDMIPARVLADAPSAAISNGLISAKIFLPDAATGFYRGVRFDWAGVFGGLTYRGHDFYPLWFNGVSPSVSDFVEAGGQVVAAPNTAANGPVEEFNAEGGALGYAEAAPGGLFLKIGVGVLRRIDAGPYAFAKSFPLVDPGVRTQHVGSDRVEMTQDVADHGTGYAYSYTKTIRLVPGQPSMIIDHALRNTGAKTIVTQVYNHNFLNIDGRGTREGLTLTTPFALTAAPPPPSDLAVVDDRRFVYRTSLGPGQRVQTALAGYGATARDYDLHLADAASGAGLRISGDQPLAKLALWSIQPVMAIEPFVTMTIKPGDTFRWSYRYDYDASGPLAGAAQ